MRMENADPNATALLETDVVSLVDVSGLLVIAYSIGAIILLGNILTLLTLITSPQLRKWRNHVILMSLAVADILVGCYEVTFVFLLYINYCGHVLAFDIFGYGFGTSAAIASSSHMICIAVDRYVAIVYPLRYEVWLTKTRIVAMVIIAWTLSLVIPTFNFFNYLRGQAALYCQSPIPLLSGSICVMVMYSVTVTSLFVMYIRVLYVARSHAKQIASFETSFATQEQQTVEQPVDKGRQREGAPSTGADSHLEPEPRRGNVHPNSRPNVVKGRSSKATKMLVPVILTYCLLWIPQIALFYLMAFSVIPFQDNSLALHLTTVIALSNSGVNVFIYCGTNTTFRQAFLSLLRCKRVSMTMS